MRPGRKQITRIAGLALGVLALWLAAAVYFPFLLAFPHRAQLGEITVYSIEPPPPRLAEILNRAARLDAASAIAAPLGPRAIYLTDGGWRWWLLSLPRSSGAFALTRPLSTNIVVNRSSIAADEVTNGAALGNRRTLAGTIAHETAHLLIYRRYGVIAAIGLPSWKVEGYCDHVARESSLAAADAERLRREGGQVPALTYFDARLKVEQALARGTVDRLMRGE